MKKKKILWIFTKNIANLNFAIFILFIICIFSLVGSLIEQDQSLLYYQLNYPVSSYNVLSFNWNTIIFLGLDHLYSTWWFILSLIILCLSLITCTFSIQLPSLRNSRRWKFLSSISYSQKVGILHKFINTDNSRINMIYVLNSNKYYVFNRCENLYSYKGLAGRIAPVFVHMSIIVTFIGSIIGLFYGFIVQEMIPKGEFFHIKNIVKSGNISILPSNYIFHVDDFYITYNENNSIKQFFSEISIFNSKGLLLFSKNIHVNSPCRFKGLTIYQTDWQINGLRLKLEQNFLFQNKLSKIQVDNKVLYMGIISVNLNEDIIFVLTDLNNKIQVYNSSGENLGIVSLNQAFNINGSIFSIEDIIVSTGLQIKSDPGIAIVYFGFSLLMISTLSSYISYSQIWVNYSYNNFELFGLTNRAILFFEEELVLIYNQYLKKINKYYDNFDS